MSADFRKIKKLTESRSKDRLSCIKSSSKNSKTQNYQSGAKCSFVKVGPGSISNKTSN